MAERLATIGRRVVDAFRIPRSSDRKRKSEPPLSPMEKVPFEEHCRQILEKDDFGREDFGNFCKSMIILARQEDDPKGFARLNDQEAKFYLDLSDNGIPEITIRSYPESRYYPRSSSVPVESLSQNVFYEPQKKDGGFFGMSLGDFQPVLDTDALVPAGKFIQFVSYFSGRPKSAFPEGVLPVESHETVSDKEVQDFCKRVYRVYAADKVGFNLPRHYVQ